MRIGSDAARPQLTRFGRAGAALALILCVGSVRGARAFDSDPLGEVLRRIGIGDVAGTSLGPSDLVRPISSWVASRPEDPARALAFYFADEMDGIFLPTDFWLVCSTRGVPRASRIRVAEAGMSRGAGALLRMHFTSHYVVIGGHWNPSRGPSVVIRLEDLAPISYFDGAVVHTLRDDRVAYQPGMVHFAPTHPARIRLRNLASGEDREIYPLVPQSELWMRRVAHVRRLYDEWGERLGNHHGDPAQFGLSLKDSRYDAASDTLVLVMNFAATERNGLRYEDGLADVAVVYRNASGDAAAEESPLDEMLRRHGAASLEELAKLRR